MASGFKNGERLFKLQRAFLVDASVGNGSTVRPKKAVLFQSLTASREVSREAARPLRGAAMQKRSEALFSNTNLFFLREPPPAFSGTAFHPGKKKSQRWHLAHSVQ